MDSYKQLIARRPPRRRELRFLLDIPSADDRELTVTCLLVSLAFHFLCIAAFPFIVSHRRTPAVVSGAREEPVRAVMLAAPLFGVTQRLPNRGLTEAGIDLELLRPRKKFYAPRRIFRGLSPSPDPAGANPVSPHPAGPSGPPLAAIAPMAPRGTGGSRLPSGGPYTGRPMDPEVPFDIVPASNARISRAGKDRKSTFWLLVGDARIPGGGNAEGQGLPAAPERVGSSLALLTNPDRVEFRPFLRTVLSRIRRQWLLTAVDEPDAGSYGETVLRFSVDASGRISEWEIVRSSASAYLDQIAAAGIQRAAPFPPLPAGFHRPSVRLEVVFSYMVRRG